MQGRQADILGWVPIDLRLDERANPVRSGLARWLDCSGVTFSETFFPQTIARLRTLTWPRLETVTTLDAVELNSERAFGFQPSGLVLHVSRCGSTAIANCLRCAAEAQVVSEAWPLTQLLWDIILSRGTQHGPSRQRQSNKLINVIAWSLATCRIGLPEKLVLKLTSSSLLALAEIRSVWPSVPCVLIVRHPLEVLVASLKGGGWMELKKVPEKQALLAGLEVKELRGSELMRLEDGQWKLVHRHADPLVEVQPAASIIRK